MGIVPNNHQNSYNNETIIIDCVGLGGAGADGGTNTVTLGMTRKTMVSNNRPMLIQDVTIKKIPTAATAVSVTIAPLWQSLTVSGTYSTTNGSSTIALTKQEDGRTWLGERTISFEFDENGSSAPKYHFPVKII